MSGTDDDLATIRARREPPRYRQVSLRRVEPVTPRMVRVTLGGPELEGLRIDEPAASVRLLLPSAGSDELVMPTWNGNEFLLEGGERPTIRTFTPVRLDPDASHPDADTDGPELVLDVVVHPGGVASAWATEASPGAPAAVSGPGRGYEIDADATAFLVAGDESALPAIAQLLAVIPAGAAVHVVVEVGHPDARLDLPAHPGATLEWSELTPGGTSGDALFDAVRDAPLPDGALVWAAGEAAAMQRIRRHLFDDRGVTRDRATVRGYWKHGRPGT